MLVDNLVKLRSLFDEDKARSLSEHDCGIIERISEHMAVIKSEVSLMVESRKVANRIEDNERERALAYHDTVIPHMEVIRRHIDKLELLVDNEMWPLPKYRELLFIR